ILKSGESVTRSRSRPGRQRSPYREVVESIQLVLHRFTTETHRVFTFGRREGIDEVERVRHGAAVVVDARTERKQPTYRELIDTGKLIAVSALRADILQGDQVGGNVGKQETAVTKAELIDLGRAKVMRFRESKEAIPLRVGPRESQIAVSAERLGGVAFVPKPSAGDVI